MSKERAARKLLTDFKDLIRFIEEVEGLGKVEAAMKAAEQKREAAEKEAADLASKAKAARDRATKAEKAEANATAERDKVLAAAQAEADRIVAEAKSRANAVLRDAGQRTAEKQRQAQAEIEAMRQSFAKEREEHDAWVARAEQESAEKEKRIAALDKQIERIREKVT